MFQFHQALKRFFSDGPDLIILQNPGKHKHAHVKPVLTIVGSRSNDSFPATNLQRVQPLQTGKHGNGVFDGKRYLIITDVSGTRNIKNKNHQNINKAPNC